MPLSNFPNGVSSFGMPVMGVGEETMTTGNVFFVDSGSTDADDGNPMDAPDKPGATIDGAMTRCTANNGDIVFVMPGHSEDVSANITMDVAGVWVRGLGWGASRPTITLTTSLTIAMSAVSTRISNIILDLTGSSITVTNGITVTAADVIIENIESLPHATSQFTNIINVASTGTRCIIRNCHLKTLITASASSGIYLDGCDDIQILNNVIMGHFGTAACIDNTTGTDQVLQALIANNWCHNDSVSASDPVIHMDDDATGLLINNRFSGGLALASNYNLGNMRSLENYTVDAPDVFDLIIPTTTMT